VSRGLRFLTSSANFFRKLRCRKRAVSWRPRGPDEYRGFR
jgi:hypothetical protein